MNAGKKIISTISLTLVCIALLAAVPFQGNAGRVMASSTSGNTIDRSSPNVITDDDRADADAQLKAHVDSILKRTHPDEYTLKKLNDTLYSAIYYIANTEMSVGELWAYVGEMKAKLDAVVPDTSVTKPTTEFLQVGNNWETPSVSYGQQVSIVLPIINLGSENLTDLVVKPVVSNDVKLWPFEPDATGYVQSFAEIPGNPYGGNYEAGMFARRELTYNFTVREDVMTGYYPLSFEIWYTKAGVRCEEPETVSVYVYTQGKPGAGHIGGDDGAVESKPRIIVTGFETNPKEIYAGDTFMVTIHVKNTSKEKAVNNVLFDMQAVESGTEANTTYAVFLPTSGSSSVYTDSIGPGSEFDINIEMTAKTDLTQKPYVITVKMKYDSGKDVDLTDEAKVSVPVLQEAKYDTSDIEAMPASISIGSQSNVMFSIYNTGKTTFYNLQVKYEGDSIEGGDTFLGTLKPGETGSVDSMITAVAPSTGDGTIKAKISFENESGELVSFERNFALDVYEEVYMDPSMPEDIPVDNQGGVNIGLIIGIAAAVVVAAVIIVIVTVRKKKKKAAALKLEEELLDTDNEE
ncbi:COG1361 S-layer family protein [Eisenbergiella tayi]|uniref:COG1361 S-layer family protein n=1 Tax=Eisenbergiella tayi TaxID=1432052 RepID=UPI000848B15C|nr:hypothetical protein [Eisenbergiella tayi]ODR32391.1 hypothetical protein BEI60_28025 [Eisenbergiella tayi]